MNFGVKFIGIEAATALIKRAGEKLRNAEAANKSALVVVDRWVQKNFESEGDLAEGGGWAPLASSTIKARQKRRSGTARILQDVGWLKSKWHHLASASMARLQSGVDYGIYHDSDAPRRKLPQRKILPREHQIMDQLKKIYDAFVGKSFGGK